MNLIAMGAGVALMWLVLFASESKDASTRMVFRSAWGAAVYGIGLVLFVAAVLA